MGVHSGRKNGKGTLHPTWGCIRTDDPTMKVLVNQNGGDDPISEITVENFCGD